jgi:hypothetical protein
LVREIDAAYLVTRSPFTGLLVSVRTGVPGGRSVKLLDLVRQLAPLLRQIEIHQSRFQRDRETAGPFTVLRYLTAFLCPIDHTQQKRAARSGCSASSLHILSVVL